MIRPATRGDAATCAAIFDDWVDATPWMPRIHPRDATLRHFRDTVLPHCRVLTAWDGDRCTGFVAAEEADVMGLYLVPEARGRGLGASLLAAIRDGGRQRLWTFAANAGARRFYAREGFAEIGRTAGDNDEGLPDLHLERRP